MNPQLTGPDTMRKGFVLTLLLVVGLGFLGMISSLLIALILAAIFAGLLYGPYNWLQRALGGRPALAAVLTLLLSLVAIGLPLGGLVGIVVAQAIEVTEQLRPWMRELMQDDAPFSRLFPGWVPYAEAVEPYREDILNKVAEAGTGAGEWLVASLSTLTQGTLGFLLGLFVMLYAMFFFLIDGPRLLVQVKSYLPLGAANRDLVVDRGLTVTRASLKGILIIGALQGFLMGLGLWAAGLTGAAFWGTIVFVLSAIPGLGAPIIWIPAAIYLIATGNLGWGIALAVWGAVVVGLVDNVLRPMIVGRDAKLSDLVVLVSILGGISVFGAVGILLGPILAAMFDTLLNIYRRVFTDSLPG